MAVDSLAWMAALALADGDASRLKIVDVDTIIVLNHGKRPIMVKLQN